MESTTVESRLRVKNVHHIQLYSAATPNGIKVAAMLEELIDLKANSAAPFNYEPHVIDLRKGETRAEWYAQVAPHGKIPLLIDPKGDENGNLVTVFESGAILFYLAERYDELLAHKDFVSLRTDTMKWLFWGSTAFSTQIKTFGFYYQYCKHRLPYCIERYAKECNRLLGVLERQLESHGKHYVVGDMYTIADISIWPWVYGLKENYGHNAPHVYFKNLEPYPAVQAWYARCMARPASKRSLEVTPFITET